MKKYFLLLLLLILIGSGIFFLNKSQETKLTQQDKTVQVNTSFYPLYFFAEQIGGDKANVHNITPAGSEPHDYEPTSQDIARIENSDILIINGGVEAWANKLLDDLRGKDVEVVTAGEGMFTQQMQEDDQTITDPHIWLVPALAKKEIQRITAAYIKKDPANSSYYQANEKSLEQKLDNLDAKYKNGLSTCKSKDIITSHAAFGYLAKAYGLNQVSIAGLSPDAEPSTQQLAGVAKFAKEHTIQYIFFESLVSPKLSETIANEIGAKTLVLDPLEGIPDDEIKQGKNYFTVMEDNLNNLQIALQCTQ